MKPDEMRRTFLESDLRRDAGLTPPEGLSITRDIPYSGYGKDTELDVYRPENGPELMPVIVSAHGGGWVYGSKEIYCNYCMSLADRGFAVVNFNYRLAPENVFPCMMEDMNSVMKWIMGHGSSYGIDRNNIFVVGDSAGGQLASQYLAAATNASFASLFPLEIPEGLNVRACALNCGVYDARGYMLSSPDNPINCYVPEHTDKILECMDTLSNITEMFPPAYIMSANRDFLLGCAEPMHTLLLSRGVESELHIWGSDETPLGHVFHLDVRNEEGKKCNDEECAFFRRHVVSG